MPFLHCPKKRETWQKLAEEKSYRTGLRHRIYYPKGGFYKGDWVRGRQTGKGVELLPNGLQYEGDWLCDRKHGFGIRSRYDPIKKSFDLVYLGDYQNNQKHGYGSQHTKKGSFYEGEFRHDKRDGFGRCWYYDGSYYEGYWEKNFRHGFGMFVQVNGNRYEGEWREGKKNGWGVFYHLDSGQKQTGVWENDFCVTSTMKDIAFRQTAIDPTPYPIQRLRLDPYSHCNVFLSAAKDMILRFNKGCQLHKYCYKIPSKSEDASTNKPTLK